MAGGPKQQTLEEKKAMLRAWVASVATRYQFDKPDDLRRPISEKGAKDQYERAVADVAIALQEIGEAWRMIDHLLGQLGIADKVITEQRAALAELQAPRVQLAQPGQLSAILRQRRGQ